MSYSLSEELHATDLKIEEESIQTNGVRLHTVMAGPPSGPPVILLHGFPDFWRGWIRQLPALVEAGCRVIIPDQRGYNLSDKPRGVRSYQTPELVQDVLGLIDALGYEKVNLVGHDWGAVLGWLLGIQHPTRLHRLGIINVPHPTVMKRFLLRDLEQIFRSWYIFFVQLPWLPEAVMRFADWRGAVRTLAVSGQNVTFTKADIEKYQEAWSQPGALTAMLNWYRAAARELTWIPKEPRVKVPTLVLWGMKDIALTHRMARPSLDYCTDGKLILFPDATHWVQHEEAEEVNMRLLDFIHQ